MKTQVTEDEVRPGRKTPEDVGREGLYNALVGAYLFFDIVQEAALQRQQKAAGLMGQLGQAGAATGLQAGSSTGQLGQQATQQALQAGQIGGQLGAQYGQMGLAGQEASAKLGLMGAEMQGAASGRL